MAETREMPARRGWTQVQCARRLGVSLAWFSAHREALYRVGFPRPDALTGKTDKKAVERYMDQRSGLIDPNTKTGPDFDEFSARVERYHGSGRA